MSNRGSGRPIAAGSTSRPGRCPSGMAKPAPSTNGSLGNKSGWEATGYDYREMTIEGFPCLHEFQIGGIALMPTSGALVTVPGLPTDSVRTGYRSRFRRETEQATAGYYSVMLDDYGIRAEPDRHGAGGFRTLHLPAGGREPHTFTIGCRQGESGSRA